MIHRFYRWLGTYIGDPVDLTLPNLVISQRALKKIVLGANRYIEDETGETMVGLIVPGTHTNGVPTVYVLDTIAPDETAVRMMHTFQQGDERQGDLFQWWYNNWEVERARLRAGKTPFEKKLDVPLAHVGDWHKQPGYMIAPSGGDLMTALDFIEDLELDFLLVPIVTLGHPGTVTHEGHANFLTVPQKDGSHLRIDWWYIDGNVRAFVPIQPAIYPEDRLPEMVQFPWHLADEERAEAEFTALQDDGLFVSLAIWEADDKPPMEICMLVIRGGSSKVLLLVTAHDYPASAPKARIAEFRNVRADDDLYEVFTALWKDSKPLDDPKDWKWSPDKRLLDYVRALEVANGLPTSKPKPEPSAEIAAGGGDASAPSGDGAAVAAAPAAVSSPAATDTSATADAPAAGTPAETVAAPVAVESAADASPKKDDDDEDDKDDD
jgi:hypothetical protein